MRYLGSAEREAQTGMNAPAAPFEWTPFMHGFVFWEVQKSEHLPPGDDAGRLEWLDGFCQAHADYPADGNFEGGESTLDALDRLLADHPALPVLKMFLRPV